MKDRLRSTRTVLVERFKALIGRPPIDYLASWRIQLAAERLRVGHESIPSIAAHIGYESEAAFIRAFRREFGVPPGNWRRGLKNGGDRVQEISPVPQGV